ncbi:hypothetical protein Aglo03_15350 [Actinokineospora globicatena]|uniref:Uncharacterized protein n=1 Tax=Actinokineospora globicatena TaxID=103729 RepID=A0A9W6QLF3_9PSEU|nr:hypothetical protein Aglo03_15350 [Actinokineospora globicatena]
MATRRLTVTEPPAGTTPIWQETVVPVVQVPDCGLALTTETPVWIGSVTTTLRASDGPSLVTVIV